MSTWAPALQRTTIARQRRALTRFRCCAASGARNQSAPCSLAMQCARLTVDYANMPVVLRGSRHAIRETRSRAGQEQSFPQNIPVHRLIRFGCVLRPFFLNTGILMTHPTDVARGRDIVARWCEL